MRTPSPFEVARQEADRVRGEDSGNRVFRSSERPTTGPNLLSQELKIKIHRKLIDTIDLTKVSTLESEQVKAEIRRILEDMVMAEALPLSRTDRERLVTEVQHEAFGLGPLEFLMADPTISDILVNTYQNVYIERQGRLERTDLRFHDDNHLMQIIERIVSRV